MGYNICIQGRVPSDACYFFIVALAYEVIIRRLIRFNRNLVKGNAILLFNIIGI